MRLRGAIQPPPDKSISHRAMIFSSIATGKSEISNILESEDTKATLNILKECGIQFKGNFKHLTIYPSKIQEPQIPLYCANSGTTARIIMGLFAGISGLFILYGDRSLSRRPMRRVIEPLTLMGARVVGRDNGNLLPIAIYGGNLHSIRYSSAIASAQVKSAVILASLFADGETLYEEPYKSRDHTERLLIAMNIGIKVNSNRISVLPGKPAPLNFRIPGDFSSAAFFITLGVIHPDADITIKDVGLNPTRTGFLNVLKRMGASIEVKPQAQEIEPYGNIRVLTSNLKGTEVTPSEIPMMIDEVPLIALLGAFAEGKTIVRGAKELRFKESDRLTAVVQELTKMGVNIKELEDGFTVYGKTGVKSSTNLDSHNDHRIAMMLSIASLCAKDGGNSFIRGKEWVKISYPSFFDTLKEVVKQ